ncbi:hypothetical protein [Streptomyces smyrnaeus]|uniref:hypothetical protein n=1 Tax=Streptomyces smyrnaeus TaxID=1387713 RepID=UPI0036897006
MLITFLAAGTEPGTRDPLRGGKRLAALPHRYCTLHEHMDEQAQGSDPVTNGDLGEEAYISPCRVVSGLCGGSGLGVSRG